MRISEQDYASMMLKKNNPDLVQAPPAHRPSKYRSIMEECQGIKFQSKKEARYFRELQARVSLGEVRYFLMQVPFILVGGVRYRCDFMEVWKDGSIHYIDVKGYKNQTYRNKRKQVESMFPVKIEEA